LTKTEFVNDSSWVGLVAVALAAVAAHATALGGGYVWLDHAHLEQGLALAAPGEWLALFTRGFAGTGFFRPLLALSLSVDAAISKTPWFFHVVTLGWHALAAVMVALAARKLGLSQRAALAAGGVFAVHPATTLVAGAIAFRSEAMIVVFLLALVVSHLSQRALFAGASLLLGALTKETAWLLAPVVVLVLELTRRRNDALVVDLSKRKSLFACEAAAFALATGLRLLHAPPFRARPVALGFDEGLGTRLAALAKSARTLLFPFEHSVCDAFAVTPITSFAALAGALVALGVCLLARNERRLGTLFLLALLPSLSLVPVMRFWSPHYLYLPLALGVMLLAQAAERVAPAVLRALVAACVPLALFSLDAGRRYANDETLWSVEVERAPACREGQFYLGEVAREAKDWRAARERYRRAARPDPRYLAYVDEAAALQNLGAVLAELDELPAASASLGAALERSDDTDERRRIAHNLATVALRAGDAVSAERLLEAETRRDDALPESLFVRARALHELDREPEALELLRRLGDDPARTLARARSAPH
jgi:tetratricopeptide (TPR) repeat protein